MLFYIDYLDHVTSGSKSFSLLERRLRFDLLVYGRERLCMSVPACVKMGDTTKLLQKLDAFWNAGTIQLQLDKKHKGRAANYFSNRKRVLSSAMPEEKLIQHFEFVAYEDSRADYFFSEYLPNTTNGMQNELFIGKIRDTDALFRSGTIDLLSDNYEPICKALDINRSIVFTGMVNRIQDMAFDNSSLFQRALVEERISDEFKPRRSESLAIATILDQAFASANAQTSDAIPISLIRNRLTGRWLYRLLYKSYADLYNEICKLSWQEVYELSQDKDWDYFIRYINCYIYLVQHSINGRRSHDTDSIIKKMSSTVQMYRFLNYLKDEAINAAKEKMIEVGMIYDALMLEEMIQLFSDFYTGRDKPLLDIVYAINEYARRNLVNLTTLVPSKQILQATERAKKYGDF